MLPPQGADPKEELKDTGVSETDPVKPEDDEFDFEVHSADEGKEGQVGEMGKDVSVEGSDEGNS